MERIGIDKKNETHITVSSQECIPIQDLTFFCGDKQMHNNQHNCQQYGTQLATDDNFCSNCSM